MLEGYTPVDESAPSASGLIMHRYRRGPPHHPYPEHHPYWDAKRAAKDELFRCLDWAVHSFNKSDADTWKPASQNLVHCVLTHLGHCADL